MVHYDVLFGPKAMESVDTVVDFLKKTYTEEFAQKYRKAIIYELDALSYYAPIFPLSRYKMAREIHPEAKTLSILIHHWTVVFHINEGFVIIDRIIPSNKMIE